MIIQILHTLLKPNLPTMHLRRFKALMAAVESGLKGASVTITLLGRAVSGETQIKHKIKRVDSGLLSLPYACDEGFRDTKATHYGLDLANESRI
jgi:hypothetical protein